MYYIENVTYFLEKKGVAESDIVKAIEILNSQTTNNVIGDGGFVTSASVRGIMDNQMYGEFEKGFKNDSEHLAIILNHCPTSLQLPPMCDC